MIEFLSPAHILIISGLLTLSMPRAAIPVFTLAAPLLGLWILLTMGYGTGQQFTVMGLELILQRLDPLSFIFSLIFLIAAFLCGIYGLDEKQRPKMQASASLIYAGAAIGAVLAGDLLTLFVYWELTALASVFLVIAPGTVHAKRAAIRYLSVQMLSGLLLLAGIALRLVDGQPLAFELIAGIDPQSLQVADLDAGGLLILIAFGIKCAFPILNGWLQDAYPEATAFGAVALSAFTTKLAIYALARGFPGYEPLIYIGAAMAVLPVFFAVIENDLRRVLAFSLNNQLGFMVAAIGFGSMLAINGAATHAFVHILYKALLFMSMGAVLQSAGTIKASELGGLWRAMPLTTLFCIIGAMSISAFPLFSGFVAKSLTMSAAETSGLIVIWLMLLFASAGVLEHSGIKIPYYAFFGPDRRKDLEQASGRQISETSNNKLLAMAITAVMCVCLGIWYEPLYAIAPYPDVALGQQPYTGAHIVSQLQLLLFAALAFIVLKRLHLYPAERNATILNSDWLYRRLAVRLLAPTISLAHNLAGRSVNLSMQYIDRLMALLYAATGPRGTLVRSWGPSFGALMIASLFGIFLGAIYLF